MLAFLLVLSFGGNGVAQVRMRSTDFPSTVGAWRRAYSDTSGASVTQRLGTPGGPQSWDFSQPPSAAETVVRVDIVKASEGACSEKPATATYAERMTRENSGCASWEYYSLETGRGRVYHGMCDPCANAAGPGVIFKEPTLEMPECTYGDSWSREVIWDDLIRTPVGDVDVEIHFTSMARVDAYGSLVLPGLGEFPVLRVNETNTYLTLLKDFGVPIDTQYFHNLYWLVPGIGKAVHIVSKASTAGPPSLLDPPSTVLRVFDDSKKARPATHLAIERVGPKFLLSWDSAGVGARYIVARGEPTEAEAAHDRFSAWSPDGLLPQTAAERSWVKGWNPILTNQQNFLLLPIPSEPGAAFYRVSVLP
ncbi:MAG: hypothetical protein IT581_11435 [Verrucomicrobiales bacterium]|nr:hypothetical protein [Verrucomicrobiales bacterium]